MRTENKIKQGKLIHLERCDMPMLGKLAMERNFSSVKKFIEHLVTEEIRKYERQSQKD